MTRHQFLAWRTTLDLGQDQAADLLGVTRQQVSRYETGRSPIPIYIALATAQITLQKLHPYLAQGLNQ